MRQRYRAAKAFFAASASLRGAVVMRCRFHGRRRRPGNAACCIQALLRHGTIGLGYAQPTFAKMVIQGLGGLRLGFTGFCKILLYLFFE